MAPGEETKSAEVAGGEEGGTRGTLVGSSDAGIREEAFAAHLEAAADGATLDGELLVVAEVDGEPAIGGERGCHSAGVTNWVRDDALKYLRRSVSEGGDPACSSRRVDPWEEGDEANTASKAFITPV
jgi:hypothetical protein